MIVYKELKTVEKELGISLQVLYAVSNNLWRHYRQKPILKRDGSVRYLLIPDGILKKIQRKIKECFLDKMEISPFAHAYAYSRSILSNASAHIGGKIILKIDIKDFFGSISYNSVKEKVFPSSVFGTEVRTLLSMLCYYKEELPQGAPTSPSISNVVMRDFDRDIAIYCAKRGICYTRYCDDLTFSGEYDSKELYLFVKERLWQERFRINAKKKAVIFGSRRKSVTGIVINQKTDTSVDYRLELRQELFYIKKFGLKEHLARIKSSDGELKHLHILLGKVNYVLYVNNARKEFMGYKRELLSLISQYI